MFGTTATVVPGLWHHDHQGALHLVEIVVEQAQEIGTGHEGNSIKSGAGENGVKGGEQCHVPLLDC